MKASSTKSPFGHKLTVFDEVDRIGAGDFLCIESAKAQEGFAHHVRSQPMPVWIFDLIPEELLLVPDPVDRHDQAAREEVRKRPHDLVNLRVEKREIIVIIFQLVVDPSLSPF